MALCKILSNTIRYIADSFDIYIDTSVDKKTMMKRLDFEYRIQQTISDDDYEIIDYVYSNHPTFKEKSDSENIDRIAIL